MDAGLTACVLRNVLQFLQMQTKITVFEIGAMSFNSIVNGEITE